YYAFALYTPPEAFRNQDPVFRDNMGFVTGKNVSDWEPEFRRVEIRTMWADPALRSVLNEWPEVKLFLLRPPVVLVHGTYDEGKICWDWEPDPDDPNWKYATPEYRTVSFYQQLTKLGYK